MITLRLSNTRRVIEVGPSLQVAQALSIMSPTQHLRLDVDPAADGRVVDIQASLTGLPLPSECTDLVICSHVLEHIADDLAAVSEIRRVLAPGGIAAIQVPWNPRQTTDEDVSATPDERVRRFGQADHVRMYGWDFDSRLASVGLFVARLTPADVLGESCPSYGLMADESLWLARREPWSSSRGDLAEEMRAVMPPWPDDITA